MTQADIAESCFDELGAVEHIVKAVECRRRVLSLIPDGQNARLYHLAAFSDLLIRRFMRLGDPADINEAIESLSQVVQHTPDGHPYKPSWLNNLGSSYCSRFERLGGLADMDEAIECYAQAVQLTPDGHPDKPNQLNRFGNSYMHRFKRLGEPENVEKAIDYHTQAVQLTPDGHPGKPSWLNSLGDSYLSRFEQLGELADVDKAIECHTQAVQHTPDGHADKPSWINNLGISYMRRFDRFGKLADVDKAIECHTQAVQLTPDSRPDKPDFLNNLGNSYLCHFEQLGELADADKAIECHTQAMQLAPDGHPHKSSQLDSLGTSHLARFKRLGELADVDKGIDYHTQAVQLTPDGHPEKPRGLSNFGNALLSRFEELGEPADVDKAIECQTRAVRLTPDDHPDKPKVLNSLGNSYLFRFECHGELADVDKAIECHTQAVQLTPDGRPDKPMVLNCLGNSNMNRFKRLGELADVDKAIEYHTHAVKLTPDGHADRPTWLNNLGISYNCRFERLGELADVDKTIECHAQAVQLTRDGHPYKPNWLNNLGNSYMHRFKHLSQLADLTHAQSAFQHGAQLGLTSHEFQFRCARNWAKASSLLGLSPQRAYERCIELLPHLIWLGTTISHRYSLLAKVTDLATEAASWAISVQSYDLAIEWLEEGRSIVWNQILQLRTPFDDLSSVDPPLAHRLKDIARQLDSAGSRHLALDHSIVSESGLEKAAQHHRRLAADWEQCLKKARSIPGFENFMQPRKAAELKTAAIDGPVVIVNIHPTRCDALIIFPQCDEVTHVPLLGTTLGEADSSVPRPSIGDVAGQRGEGHRGFIKNGPKPVDILRDRLVALWEIIVHPILYALVHTCKLSDDELPHVTWCATGPLVSLPLHAAGPYDGSSPNTFDLVISSYTPSLSALLALNPLHAQADGVLAIGQQSTKGFCPLPYTEPELEAIKSRIETARYQQLDGSDATVEAVLDAMEEHSWVHFACHATQNPDNPTKSAFHLHDGNLTLESITKRQFRNKGLAFLSACQTAKGDGKLPDEAVHLAAGMLMAGYPSVIATLWSIDDADGPEVAGRVYAELLKDGKMDHRGAARALHSAVVALREKVGEDSFERWVPFIHIGV